MSFNLASFYRLLSTMLQPRFHRKETASIEVNLPADSVILGTYFFEYRGIDLLARLSRALV